MKITINGKVSSGALSLVLNEQKDKTKIINDFCKKEKLNTFYYKDNELEYMNIKQKLLSQHKLKIHQDKHHKRKKRWKQDD